MPADLASLTKTEEAFEKASLENSSTAYIRFLSQSGILSRNGQAPAVNPEEQKRLIESTPSIQYQLRGSDIAKSGDLGYAYGTASINGKNDSYLRIWRREKEGWKIALEVLHY